RDRQEPVLTRSVQAEPLRRRSQHTSVEWQQGVHEVGGDGRLLRRAVVAVEGGYAVGEAAWTSTGPWGRVKYQTRSTVTDSTGYMRPPWRRMSSRRTSTSIRSVSPEGGSSRPARSARNSMV